jgi:hypothetical protein
MLSAKASLKRSCRRQRCRNCCRVILQGSICCARLLVAGFRCRISSVRSRAKCALVSAVILRRTIMKLARSLLVAPALGIHPLVSCRNAGILLPTLSWRTGNGRSSKRMSSLASTKSGPTAEFMASLIRWEPIPGGSRVLSRICKILRAENSGPPLWHQSRECSGNRRL